MSQSRKRRIDDDDESKEQSKRRGFDCESKLIDEDMLDQYGDTCDQSQEMRISRMTDPQMNRSCVQEAENKNRKFENYRRACNKARIVQQGLPAIGQGMCDSDQITNIELRNYNQSCNPANFYRFFENLKIENNGACRSKAKEKMRKLLNSEVACHNFNNNVERSNIRYSDEGYMTLRNDNFQLSQPIIQDRRSPILLNTNLYQKHMSLDLHNRRGDLYPQEYNDNCSIAAFHNIGLLCRDSPDVLRRFNPDRTIPRGRGVNLNLKQIYKLFNRLYGAKYPNDIVYLASLETPQEIEPYLLTQIDGEPRLSMNHVTLMMIDYYNVYFDLRQPIGAQLQINGKTVYNYPYHTHCTLVAHSKVERGRLFVFEPFKNRAVPLQDYLHHFNLIIDPSYLQSSLAADRMYEQEVGNVRTTAYNASIQAGNHRRVAAQTAENEVLREIPRIRALVEGERNRVRLAAGFQPARNLYAGTTITRTGLTNNVIRRIYFFSIQEVPVPGSNLNRRINSPARKVKTSPKKRKVMKSPLKRKLKKASPKRKVVKSPKKA